MSSLIGSLLSETPPLNQLNQDPCHNTRQCATCTCLFVCLFEFHSKVSVLMRMCVCSFRLMCIFSSSHLFISDEVYSLTHFSRLLTGASLVVLQLCWNVVKDYFRELLYTPGGKQHHRHDSRWARSRKPKCHLVYNAEGFVQVADYNHTVATLARLAFTH